MPQRKRKKGCLYTLYWGTLSCKLILHHLQDKKFSPFKLFFYFSDIFSLHLFSQKFWKQTKIFFHLPHNKDVTKITWSILNLLIFFDMKENSCEYQNLLIFKPYWSPVISWATNRWQLTQNLSPPTKLGDRAQNIFSS